MHAQSQFSRNFRHFFKTQASRTFRYVRLCWMFVQYSVFARFFTSFAKTWSWWNPERQVLKRRRSASSFHTRSTLFDCRWFGRWLPCYWCKYVKKQWCLNWFKIIQFSSFSAQRQVKENCDTETDSETESSSESATDSDSDSEYWAKRCVPKAEVQEEPSCSSYTHTVNFVFEKTMLCTWHFLV